MPVEMHALGAGELVSRLHLAAGRCTVLWHSVMWQYVDPAERVVVDEHVARLAEQSTADAPFVHLYLEPVRRTRAGEHQFLVGAEQWPPGPGDAGTVLGTAAPHGLPVVWER